MNPDICKIDPYSSLLTIRERNGDEHIFFLRNDMIYNLFTLPILLGSAGIKGVDGVKDIDYIELETDTSGTFALSITSETVKFTHGGESFLEVTFDDLIAIKDILDEIFLEE